MAGRNRLSKRMVLQVVDQKDGECNYHSCTYTGTLSQCPYCKCGFCQIHLRPKRWNVVHISTADEKDLDNLRIDDAHPCIAYTRYVDDCAVREDEIRKQKYDNELNAAKEAMDKMKSGKQIFSSLSYLKRDGDESQRYSGKGIGRREEVTPIYSSTKRIDIAPPQSFGMNSTEGAPLQAAGYHRHSVEILPTSLHSKLRSIAQMAMNFIRDIIKGIMKKW